MTWRLIETLEITDPAGRKTFYFLITKHDQKDAASKEIFLVSVFNNGTFNGTYNANLVLNLTFFCGSPLKSDHCICSWVSRFIEVSNEILSQPSLLSRTLVIISLINELNMISNFLNVLLHDTLSKQFYCQYWNTSALEDFKLCRNSAAKHLEPLSNYLSERFSRKRWSLQSLLVSNFCWSNFSGTLGKFFP